MKGSRASCGCLLLLALADLAGAIRTRKAIRKQDPKTNSTGDEPSKFGSPECPCIGIQGLEGTIGLKVAANETAPYPAEAFASCEAWDDGRNPVYCKEGQDPGKGNGWCAQKWCWVDPCNCNLDVPPKKASADGYLPKGRYQGNSLWWSYATCGAEDAWLSEEDQKQRSQEPKSCKEKPEELKWGDNSCRCIGLAGLPGTVNFSYGGEKVPFPADAGAFCKAWDEDSNPDCQTEEDAPDWCQQAWCYVDPCSCDITVTPKTSSYLPEATVQGRPIYFSYATCGSADVYTDGSEEACVNQGTEEDCSDLEDRCAWNGERCLGKELVSVCPQNTSVVKSQELSEKEKAKAFLRGKMDANMKLPPQGFGDGAPVEYDDGEDIPADWRLEYGPNAAKKRSHLDWEYEEICAKYPKNKWCLDHGYVGQKIEDEDNETSGSTSTPATTSEADEIPTASSEDEDGAEMEVESSVKSSAQDGTPAWLMLAVLAIGAAAVW